MGEKGFGKEIGNVLAGIWEMEFGRWNGRYIDYVRSWAVHVTGPWAQASVDLTVGPKPWETAQEARHCNAGLQFGEMGLMNSLVEGCQRPVAKLRLGDANICHSSDSGRQARPLHVVHMFLRRIGDTVAF